MCHDIYSFDFFFHNIEWQINKQSMLLDLLTKPPLNQLDHR